MKNKIAVSVLAASLGLMSASAFAEFVYTPQKLDEVIPVDTRLHNYAAVGIPLVTHEGTGEITKKEGFGSDLPLGKALMAVVPEHWSVYGRNTDFEQCQVSWVGGVKWTEILEDLMSQSGSSAIVSWNRNIVMVQPNNSISQRSGISKDCSSNRGGSVMAMNDDGSYGNGYDQADDVPRLFLLRQGFTLSEELVRWGRTYSPSWHVSWDIPNDYMIKLTTTFKGTFEESIKRVVQSYQARGALKGVVPTFSHSKNGNKAVSIGPMLTNEVR